MQGPSKRRSSHMTGMQGVYLAAAELTKHGLIVSPTSRSAFGADLLVTDQHCKKAWSVQVKTNFGRPRFWLLNEHSNEVTSASHVFLLVNLCQTNAQQTLLPPEFYVVPSRVVAKKMRFSPRQQKTKFYSIRTEDVQRYKDRWRVFGTPTSE